MDFFATCIDNYQGTHNLAVLNQGNGFFTDVEDTAGDSSQDIVSLVADLNGDGFDDLILINESGDGPSGFGVQLSNGDGTFKAPIYYGTIGFGSIVAGDFEDNGRLDIASDTGGSLVIFHNNGSGVFTQVASYPLNPPSGSTSSMLVAGDLNGDHKVDLAIIYAAASGTVTPYISDGNGRFTKGGTFAAGPNPVSAVIGNFSGGAYGDIAVATSTGVNVLIGNSSATFTTSKSTPYPTPSGAYGTGAHIVAADFDKDGKLDVALTASNYLYLFWGAGNGTFGSYSAYSTHTSGTGALVTESINNNGRDDLAVAGSDGSAEILYNTASRVFRATPNTHSPYATGIVAADFNGDGKKDVAVVNTPTCAAPCNGTVSVFPGEGTYFSGGKTYTIGMHGSAIAVGDINGDGVLDLVVTNATPGDHADTSILLGIKGGGFQPARNITLGSLSNDAFLVDMNGDGKLDLVEDGGVALGDGKGDFGSLTPFPDGIGFPANITNIAVADFNGDGHPDVVALFNPFPGQSYPQADVLINSGKGEFTAAPLNEFDQLAGDLYGAFAVTAGPLKSGGANDIVFAATGSVNSEITVYAAFVFVNDGKGNFTLPNSYGIGVPAGGNEDAGGAVTIADFNHDGYPDIGVSVGNGFSVSNGPNFNNFGRVFAESSGESGGRNVAVADFNNDGWPDIVFTSAYGISRLYNVPVPTVTPGSLTFTSGGTQKVTIKNTVSTSQSITVGFDFGGTAPPGGTDPFKISSNTCGTLKPGASCSISVEYSGSSKAGGTLYISANGSFIATVGVGSN